MEGLSWVLQAEEFTGSSRGVLREPEFLDNLKLTSNSCAQVSAPQGKAGSKGSFPVHWVPGVQALGLVSALVSLLPQAIAWHCFARMEAVRSTAQHGGSWVCLPGAAVGARWTRQDQSGPVSPVAKCIHSSVVSSLLADRLWGLF